MVKLLGVCLFWQEKSVTRCWIQNKKKLHSSRNWMNSVNSCQRSVLLRSYFRWVFFFFFFFCWRGVCVFWLEKSHADDFWNINSMHTHLHVQTHSYIFCSHTHTHTHTRIHAYMYTHWHRHANTSNFNHRIWSTHCAQTLLIGLVRVCEEAGFCSVFCVPNEILSDYFNWKQLLLSGLWC